MVFVLADFTEETSGGERVKTSQIASSFFMVAKIIKRSILRDLREMFIHWNLSFYVLAYVLNNYKR